MATRADDMIDRRRLRRKVTFWRVAAILILVAVVAFAASRFYTGDTAAGGSHIALVKIDGTITEDQDLLDTLERIRKSPFAKGVILSIDSPGGTTVGGEAIFDEIRRVAGEKPVVAQVGTLAASAGYMIASAADHIVARQTSIVGSIGVLVEFPNVTGLMDKLGIKLDEVKSSPLKAEPSPFNPTTEEERAMMRNLIMDSYDWFVDLIAARRPLSRDEVLKLADGSIFTGRQGLKLKLVDELGGRETARKWLVAKGLDKNLAVVEWKPQDNEGYWFLPAFSAGAALRFLGFDQAGRRLLGELGTNSIFLDGLLSVWQPEKP